MKKDAIKGIQIKIVFWVLTSTSRLHKILHMQEMKNCPPVMRIQKDWRSWAFTEKHFCCSLVLS